MPIMEDEKILKEFGAFIREGREKKGLKQEDVADLLDISRPYYTMIEAGKRDAYLALAINICRVLDLDFGQIYNEKRARE